MRNIIGFLVQVAPCAVLCLMPFGRRFRGGARRAWGLAALIVAVGLIPFLAVAVMPIVVPDAAPNEIYNPLQNIVFLAVIAALFVLYLRVVEAPAEQKAFVFSLVAFFAFFATLTSSNVSYLLGFAEGSDGFMYYPPRLAVMAGAYVVLFCAMVPLMRAVRRALAAHIAPVTWWRMTGLLAVLVVTLLVGTWLLPLDYEQVYFTMSFTITVDAIVVVWWMLRMVHRESEQAERRAELEHALRAHVAARESVADELARARARVAELERVAAELRQRADAEGVDAGSDAGEDLPAMLADQPDRPDRPVVLSTASQAVSFLPDEVAYIDSLNRVRAIHFAGGKIMQVDMTLAAIFEALPAGRFAYCHRSVVVNLRHVRAIGPAELTLADGTMLPVSRRRSTEIRDAFDRLHA